MTKTLKDCLLEGGIKGKAFTQVGVGKGFKYIVKDIHFPHMGSQTVGLYVESTDQIHENSASIKNHYHIKLWEHYEDTLVEETQITPTK